MKKWKESTEILAWKVDLPQTKINQLEHMEQAYSVMLLKMKLYNKYNYTTATISWNSPKYLQKEIWSNLFEKIWSCCWKNFSLWCDWKIDGAGIHCLPCSYINDVIDLLPQQLWRHIDFKVTLSECHLVKDLSTTVGYSLVVMVTDLCRHLTYDKWNGTWNSYNL